MAVAMSDARLSVEGAERALKRSVLLLPVPGAPPAHPRGGGDLGLAFLNTALRLDHVTRVSEQIEIVETMSARRRVSLDLSLRLLNAEQERAGERLNELRGDSPRLARTPTDPHAPRSPLIWVPIARLSRRAVAPVEVVDAEGRLVPRLTQAETLHLMQAGVYRTFRNILRAKPVASDSSSDLYSFLHHLDEARWLVKAALAYTVVNGSTFASSPADELNARGTLPLARIQAFRALDALRGEDGDDAFYRLLALSMSDYLVVVGLDASKDEHHLSYEGPLLLAKERALGRAFSRLDPRRAGLVVEYATPISSGPASYHLSVDVAPDVHIAKFLLQTTHDKPEAEELSMRLLALAEHQDRDGADPAAMRQSKVIEYELQDVFARLSMLAQARYDDWAAFARRAGNHVRCTGPLEELVSLSRRFAQGELTKLAETSWASPPELRRLATLIRDSEIGHDVVIENDPRESGAHVYWRKRGMGSPVQRELGVATTRMQLIDDSPSLIGSVLLTTAALALVVYGVAAFSFHSAIWILPWVTIDRPQLSQADAIVAVLLLTPGFLFTRLDLPSSRTILGALRELPRVLAVAAVASTTYAAMAVSTGVASSAAARAHFTISFVLLAVVVLIGLWHRAAIRSAIDEKSLLRLRPPRWLAGAVSGSSGTEAAPDIAFHAVGALHPVHDDRSDLR